ncbi:MAG: hypothetical protein JWN48_219 [Myxococcaceae bacterium]|nr:hypothetical protein [Myxococcaceae bacterium]
MGKEMGCNVAEDKISRRATLGLLAATPLWASVLSACGKKTEPDSCQDVSALNDADKAARSALQYTDRGPEAQRVCSVCTYYVAPKDPAECGSCKLIKGPVHPKGYCSGFAAKT